MRTEAEAFLVFDAGMAVLLSLVVFYSMHGRYHGAESACIAIIECKYSVSV